MLALDVHHDDQQPIIVIFARQQSMGFISDLNSYGSRSTTIQAPLRLVGVHLTRVALV